MKNRQQLLRDSAKGAAIKKAGFLTSVHALRPDAKKRLDQLLIAGISPEQALKEIQETFAIYLQNLPSKSAVYEYKKKYLAPSLTNFRHVSELDTQKIDVASLFVTHLKRFIAIDLNVLQDRWYKQLEEEQLTGSNQKMVNETGKMYMEGVKLTMDMINRLNIDYKDDIKQSTAPAE